MGALGGIGMKLLMSLLTEAVIKRIIIIALEKLVAKTATDVDNKLLKVVKETWNV
jgi:hypothetical protein